MTIRQWRFSGTGEELRSGRRVTLRNQEASSNIRYGEREYGINLVWDESSDLANVSVHRSGDDDRPITYGERVAIRVSGGGYLRYEEREYGINLVWSEEPVPQWEVTGRAFGRAVRLTETVGLLNRFHGDYTVYGTRRWGINLRWWSDLDNYGDYPPLPMPSSLRGPSGEPGQIMLTGNAETINLFHGGTDDELDWHVYIRLDPAVQRQLFNHLIEHGGARHAHPTSFGAFLPLREEELERIYCELMVVDGYDNSRTDEKWYSADVTRALMLDRIGWNVSAQAAEEQGLTGATVDVTADSELTRRRARVSLQGRSSMTASTPTASKYTRSTRWHTRSIRTGLPCRSGPRTPIGGRHKWSSGGSVSSRTRRSIGSTKPTT